MKHKGPLRFLKKKYFGVNKWILCILLKVRLCHSLRSAIIHDAEGIYPKHLTALSVEMETTIEIALYIQKNSQET
jgi:hypothetical protein